MNGFGKALVGMIHVSMNRTIARSLLSGVTMLVLAGIVLLVVVGSASAGEQGGTGCVNSTGWAYQCGDTVTESCTLNRDMSCPPDTHCLVIGADDITIDGAGYKISGNLSGVDWTFGVYAYDCDDLTVENLEVEQFDIGIRIKANFDGIDTACYSWSERPTIDNCNVHHCGEEDMPTHGIQFICAPNGSITNCMIHDNTGEKEGSCNDGGNGIQLYGLSSHTLVDNNTIYRNKLAGIYSKMMCKQCTVSNNRVYENGETYNGAYFGGGIRLQCVKTNNWTVEHNRVLDNSGPGIYTRGESNCIRYNIVSGSKNASTNMGPSTSGLGNGFYSCGDGNTLISNTFCDNEVKDISVLDTFPVTGNNNTCNTTLNHDDDETTGCTYNCPGEADLNITVKYEQWFGEVYNVTYTIKNLGNSTADESTTGIYIDLTFKETQISL